MNTHCTASAACCLLLPGYCCLCCCLQLVRPEPAGRAGEGFAPVQVVRSFSLIPQKVMLGRDRRPVSGWVVPPRGGGCSWRHMWHIGQCSRGQAFGRESSGGGMWVGGVEVVCVQPNTF